MAALFALDDAIFVEEDSEDENEQHDDLNVEYVPGETHIMCHVKGFGLDDRGASYMVRPSRKIMCVYRTFAQAANVNWVELRICCRRKLLSPYKTFQQCKIQQGDLLVVVLTGGRKVSLNLLSDVPKQWVIVREHEGQGRTQLFRVPNPKLKVSRIFKKWADIIGENVESLTFCHHEAHLSDSDGLLTGDETFEDKKIVDRDGIDVYKWIPGTPSM